MPHAYVYHHAFICGNPNIEHAVAVYARHDSLIHMWDMTHSYISYIWCIHAYVRHDFFIHMRNVEQSAAVAVGVTCVCVRQTISDVRSYSSYVRRYPSYVRHDAFLCATWRIHMWIHQRQALHRCRSRCRLCTCAPWRFKCAILLFIHATWHFTCVTWLVRMCTHQRPARCRCRSLCRLRTCMRMCDMTLHTCDTNHSYVDTFLCWHIRMLTHSNLDTPASIKLPLSQLVSLAVTMRAPLIPNSQSTYSVLQLDDWVRDSWIVRDI